MAVHETFNNSDRMPLTRSEGHDHDVLGLDKHLKSHTGEKGASVADPQDHLANKEYDTEAHFTSNPHPLQGQRSGQHAR